MQKQYSAVQGRHAGMIAESVLHQHFSGRSFQEAAGAGIALGSDYAMDEMEALLPKSGIGFQPGVLDKMIDYAMDTIAQPTLPSMVTTPIQFLQNWLPGIVEIVTAPQLIDEIVGRDTVGSWEDAEVVQQVVQLTGAAVPYTDLGNVPLSSWNPAFVTRAVVRFELGLRVGVLEEAQAAKMRVDSAGLKRRADAQNLEIQRNAVGFYGYNSGLGRTYGLLNDPNLPAYINAPNGNWQTATFQQIRQDLVTAFARLRTNSKGRIDPSKTRIVLVLPVGRVDFLSVATDFGMTIYAWLKEFYPNVRIVAAPQFDGANGGQNIFYMFAETVRDSGTDNGNTFAQIVPAVFQLLGVQKMIKAYEEDYSNATAGVLLKRPYAVVRVTGI